MSREAMFILLALFVIALSIRDAAAFPSQTVLLLNIAAMALVIVASVCNLLRKRKR